GGGGTEMGRRAPSRRGWTSCSSDLASSSRVGSSIPSRPLGGTGLTASVLGLGAGRSGGPETTDADGDLLLGTAAELGVTLVDTARSYGASEERLGRALQAR